MPVLHLGVIDQPYNEPPGKGHNRTGAKTTGDVAKILEGKYHIMEIFFEEHKEDIAKSLEISLQGALENLLNNSPISGKPFERASAQIENRFKKFISEGEIERLGYPGIPTRAALRGVNHRLDKKRGPRRPSFIDTSLYENSFKAWVD